MKISENIKGISWYIFACFNLAVLGAIIRHLSDSLDIFIIIGMMNVLCFPLFIPWFIKTDSWLKPTKNKKTYVVRAFIGLAIQFSWGYALTVAPLPYVTAINFTAPLFTVILAIIIFGEQFNLKKTLALISGFVGAIVVIRPFHEEFQNATHYAALLVLAGAFLRSIANIIIKSLTKEDSGNVMLFYVALVMAIISLPLVIFFWQPEVIILWPWFIAMVVVSNFFFLTLAFAYKNAPLVTVMPFDFTTLIFVSIIAYFAFSQVVDLWTVIGSTIIILSGAYAMRYEFGKKPGNKERQMLK